MPFKDTRCLFATNGNKCCAASAVLFTVLTVAVVVVNLAWFQHSVDWKAGLDQTNQAINYALSAAPILFGIIAVTTYFQASSKPGCNYLKVLSTLGIFLVVCASSVLFVQHAAFSDACSATLDATLTGTYIGGAVGGYMGLQTIALDVVDANAAPNFGSLSVDDEESSVSNTAPRSEDGTENSRPSRSNSHTWQPPQAGDAAPPAAEQLVADGATPEPQPRTGAGDNDAPDHGEGSTTEQPKCTCGEPYLPSGLTKFGCTGEECKKVRRRLASPMRRLMEETNAAA